MNLEKEIIESINSAIHKSIGEVLSGYSSPLRKYIEYAVSKHSDIVTELLDASLVELKNNDEFKAMMRDTISRKIAKELVNQFGEGIFKQQIDKLKADPTIKARCILAVEGLLKEQK